MDWMHQFVPEEEVYQLLVVFLLGVALGGVACLVRTLRAERSPS